MRNPARKTKRSRPVTPERKEGIEMDVNPATFFSLFILGTGIFTLLLGGAMLKFGNNRVQALITVVVGLVFLGLWAVLSTSALEDAEVPAGLVGFLGALIGVIAGFGTYLMCIMKS
jgi:hypothetical protein